MKWRGIIAYFVSLFLLYISTGIDATFTLASVSLSVLYVWTVLLRMALHGKKKLPDLVNLLLLVSLSLIVVNAFVIGLTGAILLLIILLVLQGFVLLMRHGLNRKPVARNVDSRLKYFGILLLGFFSLNPFVEGVSTSNWIEAIASVMLVVGGYLMFEDVKNTLKPR